MTHERMQPTILSTSDVTFETQAETCPAKIVPRRSLPVLLSCRPTFSHLSCSQVCFNSLWSWLLSSLGHVLDHVTLANYKATHIVSVLHPPALVSIQSGLGSRHRFVLDLCPLALTWSWLLVSRHHSQGYFVISFQFSIVTSNRMQDIGGIGSPLFEEHR